MNMLLWFALAFGVLLGVGHGLDLALWTDPVTGLSTAGSVWLRYAALAVGVLLCLAAGRVCAAKPQELVRRRPRLSLLTLLAGVCFAAAAFSRAALALGAGQVPLGTLARAALELVCAVWLVCVGLAWQRSGAWRAPAGSLILAVAGGAVFYVRVLARFMENSSSWHCVANTAQVWQLLAALVFLAALARALYLPAAADGKALCASGLAAFCLCFCWQVPLLAGSGLPDACFGLGLCGVGALGGACAVVMCRPQGPKTGAEIG